MLQLQVSAPSLKSGLYSALLKPAFLIGTSGITSVGVVSSLNTSDQGTKEILEKVKSKVAVVTDPITSTLGEGIGNLFGVLGGWSKKVVNSTEGLQDKLNDYLQLSKIPSGTKIMFSNIKDWAEKAGSFIKEYLPKLQKIEWNSIRDKIAQYGDKAVNLLSLLKNIFDSKGGDTLLITKLFEALGKDKFGEFASAMGGLMAKQPGAFDNLSMDEVGKMFDSFNSNPENTIKTIQQLEQESENVTKEKLMAVFDRNSLEARAERYKAEAQKILEEYKQKKKVDRNKLEELIGQLTAVTEEIRKITSQYQLRS